MKISIITVTFNSDKTLEETILSVINQTYKKIEYIIIDGGSTDNTLNIIDKYKNKINYFISEKDQGLYEALNKGIKKATGDVIGFIHSDDFYTSNIIIEKYASEFLKSKSDAVYSDLYYVNALNTDDVIRKWKSGEYKPKSFYFGWMPPHPTFFVKKNIYKTYGDFNLNLKSAADYELMLRFILKNKIVISYLPDYTIKMRIGGKSNASFSNRFKANKEDRQAWDINGLKPKFYTLYFKPLRKLIQFF